MTILDDVMKEIEKECELAWERHKPEACRDEFVCDFKDGYSLGATFGYELAQKQPPASGQSLWIGKSKSVFSNPGDHWQYDVYESPMPNKAVTEFREVTPQDEAREKAALKLVEAITKYRNECETVAPDALYKRACRALMFKALADWKKLK